MAKGREFPPPDFGRDKADKAAVLPRFRKIEVGGNSSGGGTISIGMAALPAENLPWRPCV